MAGADLGSGCVERGRRGCEWGRHRPVCQQQGGRRLQEDQGQGALQKGQVCLLFASLSTFTWLFMFAITCLFMFANLKLLQVCLSWQGCGYKFATFTILNLLQLCNQLYVYMLVYRFVVSLQICLLLTGPAQKHLRKAAQERDEAVGGGGGREGQVGQLRNRKYMSNSHLVACHVYLSLSVVVTGPDIYTTIGNTF